MHGSTSGDRRRATLRSSPDRFASHAGEGVAVFARVRSSIAGSRHQFTMFQAHDELPQLPVVDVIACSHTSSTIRIGNDGKTLPVFRSARSSGGPSWCSMPVPPNPILDAGSSLENSDLNRSNDHSVDEVCKYAARGSAAAFSGQMPCLARRGCAGRGRRC